MEQNTETSLPIEQHAKIEVEEKKVDLRSVYGGEHDVIKLKHIIYETLEELGLVK